MNTNSGIVYHVHSHFHCFQLLVYRNMHWTIETPLKRRLTSTTQLLIFCGRNAKIWRDTKNAEVEKFLGDKISERKKFVKNLFWREKKIWIFYLIFLKRKKFREIRFLKYKIQRFFFYREKSFWRAKMLDGKKQIFSIKEKIERKK